MQRATIERRMGLECMHDFFKSDSFCFELFAQDCNILQDFFDIRVAFLHDLFGQSMCRKKQHDFLAIHRMRCQRFLNARYDGVIIICVIIIAVDCVNLWIICACVACFLYQL